MEHFLNILCFVNMGIQKIGNSKTYVPMSQHCENENKHRITNAHESTTITYKQNKNANRQQEINKLNAGSLENDNF